MRRLFFTVTVLMMLMTLLPMLKAQSGAGSFAFTLRGYTVQGQLVNAVIQEGNVMLTMVVNDNLQTPIGGVPITGSGQWIGAVNGVSLSGTIQNVQVPFALAS
jgi:uncharacterized protein GlcG (DUF336 family)